MTAQHKEHLLKEARDHFDWLRHRGRTLNDIEVTTREILRLWNLESTMEVARAQAAYTKPVKVYKSGPVVSEPEPGGVFTN